MRSLILLLIWPLAACATMPVPRASGVQVAVAFDQAGERGAAVQGHADPKARRLATADDPVRIASISKLVVAIGVMRLVEQRKLDLDRPVGDYLGYKVENPAFPIQAVSQSEGGFELVHQSATVVPRWPVRADSRGRWSVELTFALDTTAAEAKRAAGVLA